MKYILAVFLTVFTSAASAEGISIDDSFARVARPGAPTGAIFMHIHNESSSSDRLISAASSIAKRVELHTHVEKDGVMSMLPAEDGFEIPAEGSRILQRGGDHVMLMGLNDQLEDGMTIELTLTFEIAGDMTVTVPVDSKRGQGGHGN